MPPLPDERLTGEVPPDRSMPHESIADEAARRALEAALERVGDRWSFLIVAALLDGPGRFGELLEQLPGLSPNILSARLKHLEAAGVVVARPYSERPARFSYGLTSTGSALAEVVGGLTEWGRRVETGAGPVAEDDDVRFL